MEKTSVDPNEHLHGLGGEFKNDMIELDHIISQVMEDLPRTLWHGIFWGGSKQDIVAYGDLFYLNSKGKRIEWFMIGLAQQKKYISLYVNAVENGQYLSEVYGKRLGQVKVGRSSISFAGLKSLNIDILKEFLLHAKRVMVA